MEEQKEILESSEEAKVSLEQSREELKQMKIVTLEEGIEIVRQNIETLSYSGEAKKQRKSQVNLLCELTEEIKNLIN